MKKTILSVVVAGMAMGSACADTWFDTKIDTYTAWPTNNAVEYKGTWGNADTAILRDGALDVDSDIAAPLAFQATESKCLTNGAASVTFDSQVTFTPFVSDDLPEVDASARAGIVVVTNIEEGTACTYYVLAKSGDANVWTNTGIEASESLTAISAKMEDGKVTYVFGANEFVVDAITDGTLATASVVGTGTLAALSSTWEGKQVIVEFSFAYPDGVTVYSVTNLAGVLKAPYQAALGSEVWVTYKTVDGKFFADGSRYYTKKVIAAAGEFPSETCDAEVKDAAARIGTEYYLTFSSAAAAVQEGETITLVTNCLESATVAIAKNNVTLDFNGYLLEFNGTSYCLNVIDITNFTLNDSSAEKTGMLRKNSDATVVQIKNSSVVVNGGTYRASADQSSVSKGSLFKVDGDTASLVVNGGTLDAIIDDPQYVDREFTISPRKGSVTINGGTFIGPIQTDAGYTCAVSIIVMDGEEVRTTRFSTNENYVAYLDNVEYTLVYDKTDSFYHIGQEEKPQPVAPGSFEPEPFADPQDATNEVDKINSNKADYITPPADIADTNAYISLFAAKSTEVGELHVVTIDLTEPAKTNLQVQVDADVVDTTTAAQLIDATAETATATTTPGLYYWIVGGTDVKVITTPGEKKLATETSTALPKPNLGTTSKTFYRIKADYK